MEEDKENQIISKEPETKNSESNENVENITVNTSGINDAVTALSNSNINNTDNLNNQNNSDNIKEHLTKEEKEELNYKIENIAKTGKIDLNEWENIKVNLSKKIYEVIQELSNALEDNYIEQISEITKELNSFKRQPFTIQRICELLSQPKRYYKSAKKFSFAFFKLVDLDKN